MVIRLPANYVSPQGISYPNYWAYSENGVISLPHKTLAELMEVLEPVVESILIDKLPQESE